MRRRFLLLLLVGLALAAGAPARADVDDWQEAPTFRSAAPPTLWDVYAGASAEPAELALTVQPAMSVVKVGTELRFATRVRDEGWLVVVEHGTSGLVHLLFPSRAEPALARVAAGQVVDIPPRSDQAYAPDSPGLERMRAIWFASEDGARDLLASLEAAGATGAGAAFGPLQSRLRQQRYGGEHCTSHLNLRVTP